VFHKKKYFFFAADTAWPPGVGLVTDYYGEFQMDRELLNTNKSLQLTELNHYTGRTRQV
jgi:hypothetical protein